MNKMKITLERELITYSDLWRTSEVLLEKAKAEPQGSYYLILGSLTFSSFALEAFLNHLGENIFGSWIDLESISPRAKLNVICERIKIKPSWGVQPWQVVPEIVGFRNKIAHGKNSLLKFEDIVPEDKYDEALHQFLYADWQELATEKNASDVRVALEKLFKLLHKAADIDGDHLFHHGAGTGRCIQ